MASAQREREREKERERDCKWVKRERVNEQVRTHGAL